ncbi:MAG TPA: trypsin-like peptidase domain-containing protein, partial [Brevibacterium sp.]|nr:trypsin-like peptidase domain-containing protein [Brevibacterium sp.]
PGWGALIAAAVAAAVVGGALGGGGAWLLSDDASPVAAPQSQDSPSQSDRSINQSTETPDWAQIADQTTPGVAAIQIGVNGEVSGLGSGFVYDDQGHVITNNHVVAPADTEGGEVQVVMTDGATITASIVGRDPETDVAVLELETIPDNLTPLPIGSSEELFVGDPVMALGNPLGLADSVTTGIVSALDRPVSTENIGDVSEQEVEMTITNAIQTDAAINPGNSGGPLVNGNGEVIGVNSSAATLSDPSSSEAQSGSIGIGFAITIEQATNIADQLITTGEALHPFLGVTMVNSTVEAEGVTRGAARVESVEDGTPAAAAGFEAGDHIIAMGEDTVTNGVTLQALVRSTPAGEPVEFTIIRDGQEQTLQATLEAR